VDCMYGSATALYLLGEYDQARVSWEWCEDDTYCHTTKTLLAYFPLC
jgi:hypothetical protein